MPNKKINFKNPLYENGEKVARVISGTVEYWRTQSSYVPPKGTILIYTNYMIDEDRNIPAFKIGDGNAYAVDLPFIGGTEQLLDHISNLGIHVTQNEKLFWNSKWRGYLDPSNLERLVFTTN